MFKLATGTTLGLLIVITSQVALAQPSNKKIVHDAEYDILEAQNGKKWAVEAGQVSDGDVHP
jgi:hypothetical protein